MVLCAEGGENPNLLLKDVKDAKSWDQEETE